MVFQEPRLMPWRSVVDNVRIAAPEARAEEIDALLSKLSLMDHAAHFPDELSLGLAHKILDILFPVLTDLHRQGLSILLVEQMASYAIAVTHRTYVMENGRVLFDGASADLGGDDRVLDAYLGRRGKH
ncbi:MAG: hypothetical protein ACKO4X_15650, partial [Alphaproteobacteria bacterium]